MAKKGRGGKKRGKSQFKRLGAPKKGGKRSSKKRGKVGILHIKSGADVWDVQNALRKDKYFARAVGPTKIATNAPIAKA